MRFGIAGERRNKSVKKEKKNLFSEKMALLSPYDGRRSQNRKEACMSF